MSRKFASRKKTLMQTDRNYQFYGDAAQRYDGIVSKADYSLPRLVYDHVVARREVKDAEVLDIGIGTGLSSIAFAEAGARVTGIDASAEMLAECERKAFTRTLKRHDLTLGLLPAFTTSFDIVVCLGIYEFVHQPSAFLQSVHDIMRPEALFVLAIRDACLNDWISIMPFHDLLIDARAFRDHGMVAAHHDYSHTVALLRELAFEIVLEEDVFAYRSPTQDADTLNRLVIAQR